ncbi:hypothetical protein BGW41_003454 [Actinomortierella wolfii]|nr:hypothetical protein BGW41_003454 [Actinomortierella wolfii]
MPSPSSSSSSSTDPKRQLRAASPDVSRSSESPQHYHPPVAAASASSSTPNLSHQGSQEAQQQHHVHYQHGTEYFQSSSATSSSDNPVYYTPSKTPLSGQQTYQPFSSPLELQPYIPPPPSSTTTNSQTIPSASTSHLHQLEKPWAQQQHQQEDSQPNHMPKGHPSSTRLASPAYSRRHSASGTGPLSIQTSNLSHVRRGPSTADHAHLTPTLPLSATSSHDRKGQPKNIIETETFLKGAARQHLRNTGGATSAKAVTTTAAATVTATSAGAQSTTTLVPLSSPNIGQQGSSSGGGGGAGSSMVAPVATRPLQNRPQPPTTASSLSIQSASEKASSLQHAQAVETIKRSGTAVENSRIAMALMQQYLTNPYDPESEKDIEIQIQISQAAVDAKGFEVLYPHQVDDIKNHHASVSNRITALTTRLALESKIRDAAQALLRLHANKKKLAEQASEHLEAANRKVDQVATELWKLTQLAAELQRTLLQHTAGVLALGVVRLEDQTRRERDARFTEEHKIIHDIETSQEIAALHKTIQNLEDDALEAQSLLEDKDKAIARLMKQLDHQQKLFAKLDEQQQKAMAISRSHQLNLEALGGQNDAIMADMRNALDRIGQRLQHILEQQHVQEKLLGRNSRGVITKAADDLSGKVSTKDQHAIRKRSSEKTITPSSASGTISEQQSWSSSTTEIEQRTPTPGSATANADSSGQSSDLVQANTTTSSSESATATALSKAPSAPSLQAIYSALDALETYFWQSLQKASYLESELALVRRQSQTLSQSRQNSLRHKEPPMSTSQKDGSKSASVPGSVIKTAATPSSPGGLVTATASNNDPIRAALEKSLKDAILEKEKARQELENERQRWQEDQQQRIKALEDTLAAAKQSASSTPTPGQNSESNNSSDSNENGFVELRRQLQEALEEIDQLNNQHKANLKSMQQLFDILPDVRKNAALSMTLSSPKQLQLQQHNPGSPRLRGLSTSGAMTNGRASPAGSIASLRSVGSSYFGGPAGFNMEVLMARVKDLVLRSQRLENENMELRRALDDAGIMDDHQNGQGHPTDGHVRITKKELERFQASSRAIQELESELAVLKQHTDVLLEENSRLADLAATSATNNVQSADRDVMSERSSLDQGLVKRIEHGHNSGNHNHRQQSASASTEQHSSRRENRGIKEMEEMLRAKDQILRERDQFVRQQDEELQRLRKELQRAYALNAGNQDKKSINGSTAGTDTAVLKPSGQGVASPEPTQQIVSDFEANELQEYRIRCGLLEEELGEMRMMVAAFESVYGGRPNVTPGSRSPQPSAASWFPSIGSLSFASLTGNSKNGEPETPSTLESPGAPSTTLSPSSNASWSTMSHAEATSEHPRQQTGSPTPSAPTESPFGGVSLAQQRTVAGATAALRREFRRVMTDLRNEKEMMVRKEVEERRRLEGVVRQLRRELAMLQDQQRGQ